jgi:hypothetical protein
MEYNQCFCINTTSSKKGCGFLNNCILRNINIANKSQQRVFLILIELLPFHMDGSSVLDLYFLSTIFIKFSIWGRRLIYNNYIPFYNKKINI